MKVLKNFFKEEDGLGTVEIILILAVLVAIAIIFRGVIIGWVNDAMTTIFPNKDAVTNNGSGGNQGGGNQGGGNQGGGSTGSNGGGQ